MIDFSLSKHKPLRELVYEEIKSKILKGEIPPGTRMMEEEIAENIGVSRTPIREAIRQLEKEGLVTLKPRKGAYVSDIIKKDMQEILEVRENMEGLAAAYAAERMSDEEKDELEQVAKNFIIAVKTGNTEDMIFYDTDFHHKIVLGTKNQILIKMVEQLQELVLRFRYLHYDDFKRAELMIEEHENILLAIKTCDVEGARQAAFSHIEKLREMIDHEEYAMVDEAK